MIAIVGVPYVLSLFSYRGLLWKATSLYVISSTFDAIYDMGMYLHFFIQAPSHMRSLLTLADKPDVESFGAIQTRLYMRYCAQLEIKKAT